MANDCPDLNMIGNQCTLYAGQGLCKLPKRVYCMIYDGENRKGKLTSISPSSIDTYRSCHMQWLNQSYKQLRTRTTAAPLAMGLVGHMALAEWYKSGSVDLNLIKPALATYNIAGWDDKTLDYQAVNLATVLENYFDFYPQGEFPNAEIEKPLPIIEDPLNAGEGYGIHGFADLWLEGAKTIVEHKFLDNVELKPLAYKTQKVSYLSATGADQVIMNLVKKPRTYPKRTENLKQYKERLDEEIKNNPSKFFNRITVRRGQYDLPYEQQKIKELIDEINQRLESDSFDSNPKNCQWFGCDFESICETYTTDERYIVHDKSSANELSEHMGNKS